jgi:hypothetical protein
MTSGRSTFRLTLVVALTSLVGLGAPTVRAQAPQLHGHDAVPVPPLPEPVTVDKLPLPPTVPLDASPVDVGGTTSVPAPQQGSCTTDINPHGTGCLDPSDTAMLEGPAYMWDGKELVLSVVFAGAPSSGPSSIYSGSQVILIKTDGSAFSNGDPWKCVTCGVPAANTAGASTAYDHPQPVHDGRRILAGTNIIDCSPYLLISDDCTPSAIHVYPLYWDVGSGSSGSLRELRLNPDDVHIGWNHLILGPDGGPSTSDPTATPRVALDEFAYMGRLVFDPSASRYDLTNVWLMYNAAAKMDGVFFHVDPDDPTRLQYKQVGAAGEYRGFTSDGRSEIGIGNQNSDSTDAFATDLTTGVSRQMTRDLNYTDPITSSPDDNWSVAEEARIADRLTFISGLPGVPAITDLLPTAAVTSGIRNNGNRRFFVPVLLDRYAERGTYRGQALNLDYPPTSRNADVGDANWGTRANPAWSPDGTAVVYWQALVTAPDCGAPSLLVCPTSNEPGGRRTRLMIAHLTKRKPLRLPNGPVPTVPDEIAWGTPYHPGDPTPVREHIPGGNYTLPGQASGSAAVQIVENPDRSGIAAILVSYSNYSDDGQHILNGTESVAAAGGTAGAVTFNEDLTVSGADTGTKTTTPGGFTVTPVTSIENRFAATGLMTTTINGITYFPPLPVS